MYGARAAKGSGAPEPFAARAFLKEAPISSVPTLLGTKRACRFSERARFTPHPRPAHTRIRAAEVDCSFHSGERAREDCILRYVPESSELSSRPR